MFLTNLQRRILAVLEEAGEENVSALTNTVSTPHGMTEEIIAMADAIAGLVGAECVRIATHRDDPHRRWIPLSSEDTSELLRDLKSHFEWSDSQGYWKWRTDFATAVVLLTDSGKMAAQRVLSEDGWPEEPLDSYE